MFRGWIALDIDGTVTLEKYSVPAEVIAYLKRLNRDGWKIAMVTGRAYAFAEKTVSEFDFPFYFVLQNGSLTLSLPEKKVIGKYYIPKGNLDKIDLAFEGIHSDYLVYAGYERGDFCYYRPQKFPEKDLAYLQELQSRQDAKWVPLSSFESAPISDFPLVKCFGPRAEMDLVQKRLEQSHCFQVSQIRDIHAQNMAVLLITDKEAAKGLALQKLVREFGKGKVVIAAGDDENDISLLDAADIKIAMPHAPKALLEKATLIAPPTSRQGIIRALEEALAYEW